jgi:nucleoside-diphosphate-sugar epimerase
MIRWKVYLDFAFRLCVSINIGNPDEITIKDFADEIIKLTGTNQKWFIFLYQSMILCNDNQTLQKQEIVRVGS